MALEFTMEFRIGFNGKVSNEGDIEVVMEVEKVKRTIGDFAEEY